MSPPAACANGLQVARHHACPSLSAVRARLAIAERPLLGADDLVVLVPLAGDHDDVARLRVSECLSYRFLSIRHDLHCLR